eukprot:Nk52_evm43s158 gene=Nk52_evmTU43s158
MQASYPLRFNTTNSLGTGSSYDPARVFVLHHGNLKAGDESVMNFDVEPQAQLYVTTNRPKTVLDCQSQTKECTLSNNFRVGPGGLCVYWPKTNNCKGNSLLRQTNVFDLTSVDSSLVFLDWMTVSTDYTEYYQGKDMASPMIPQRYVSLNEVNVNNNTIFSSQLKVEAPINSARKWSGDSGVDLELEARGENAQVNKRAAPSNGVFEWCTLQKNHSVYVVDLDAYQASACCVLYGPGIIGGNVQALERLPQTLSSAKEANPDAVVFNCEQIVVNSEVMGVALNVSGRSACDIEAFLKMGMRELTFNDSLWS